MSYEVSLVLAPALVWLFALVLLATPELASLKKRQWAHIAALATLLAAAVAAPTGVLAFGVLTAVALVHAAAAFKVSRTAALTMAVVAAACGVAAAASWLNHLHIAFGASLVALAFRCGLFPVHAGIAALCDRLPRLQSQQLASLVVLVYVHLRFVDHTTLAHDAAIPVVLVGAASMLAFGLVSLAQRNLVGLFRASTLMHGGMLFAAVGAAGRGHYAAALIVAITMAMALTGFSIMLNALEARAGALISLSGGGRARAFPRMAASLLFFGGAAVGLPGTSGFVADDLLLHALWGESVSSAVMMILASALLAVAILATFTRTFLGKPVRQLAPDLQTPERVAVIILVVCLVALGLVPALLVKPVSVLMG